MPRQTTNNSSTTTASRGNKENQSTSRASKSKRLSAAEQAAVLDQVAQLSAQLELANKERDQAKEMAQRHANSPRRDQAALNPADADQIQVIMKPKGEAGDGKRGFNLRDAMDLDGDDNKELYEAIQRSVKNGAIMARLDMSADYRRQDPEKIADVFKYVRKVHAYMTRKRFPADWAAGEMLKQYLRNYRRYSVKKGRMESREAKKQRENAGVRSRFDDLPDIEEEGAGDE
ncbi:hypothetical protein HWV62_33035 [Athelia sp. TMB]|nr:hypothetical protein HWV62_33035 [Athelia sp. TMB]